MATEETFPGPSPGGEPPGAALPATSVAASWERPTLTRRMINTEWWPPAVSLCSALDAVGAPVRLPSAYATRGEPPLAWLYTWRLWTDAALPEGVPQAVYLQTAEPFPDARLLLEEPSRRPRVADAYADPAVLSLDNVPAALLPNDARLVEVERPAWRVTGSSWVGDLLVFAPYRLDPHWLLGTVTPRGVALSRAT